MAVKQTQVDTVRLDEIRQNIERAIKEFEVLLTPMADELTQLGGGRINVEVTFTEGEDKAT